MWRTPAEAVGPDLGTTPSDEAARTKQSTARSTTSEADLVAIASPDEVIAEAHGELTKVLADDLLEQMGR